MTPDALLLRGYRIYATHLVIGTEQKHCTRVVLVNPDKGHKFVGVGGNFAEAFECAASEVK
jgi:hypothetical protein